MSTPAEPANLPVSADVPPLPPPYGYKGDYKTARVPPCSLTNEDLQRLASELRDFALEALNDHFKSVPPLPEEQQAAAEQAKEYTRENLSMTIGIVGANGEQMVTPRLDEIDKSKLPSKLLQIDFDCGYALGAANFNLPNKFKLRLDFSDPPWIQSYDPWQDSTPNGSIFEVSGPDRTWVNGVYQKVQEFFRARKRNRGWLHSTAVFTVIGFLIGLPLSLLAAYRADTLLAPTLGASTALRAGLTIYVFLLAFFIYRLLFGVLRWLYPVLEYGEGIPNRLRLFLTGLVGTMFLGGLIDLIRFVVGSASR